MENVCGALCIGFVAWLALGIAYACNVDGDHKVKVSGGTTNRVEVDETFCDPETYPVVADRRACKDALLAAMKCRDDK